MFDSWFTLIEEVVSEIPTIPIKVITSAVKTTEKAVEKVEDALSDL